MWVYKYAPLERKATRVEHQITKQRYGIVRLVGTTMNATEAKQIVRAMNVVERERYGL